MTEKLLKILRGNLLEGLCKKAVPKDFAKLTE